jgi:hypothetical protein
VNGSWIDAERRPGLRRRGGGDRLLVSDEQISCVG